MLFNKSLFLTSRYSMKIINRAYHFVDKIISNSQTIDGESQDRSIPEVNWAGI